MKGRVRVHNLLKQMDTVFIVRKADGSELTYVRLDVAVEFNPGAQVLRQDTYEVVAKRDRRAE